MMVKGESMVTPEELAEWKQARKKAIPGLWYHNPHSPMFVGDTHTICLYSADNPNPLFEVGRDTVGGGYPFRITSTKAGENADFVALAANQWERLIDEVERQRALTHELAVTLSTVLHEIELTEKVGPIALGWMIELLDRPEVKELLNG